MQQTPQRQPQNDMGMQKIPALLVSMLDESSAVSKSHVISSTQTAPHIATLGYLFMGVSVAIRGVLQGFGEICTPLIISVLRLIFPTLPLAYLFTLRKNAAAMIWWAFPISEVVAAAVSCAFLLRRIHKQKCSKRPRTMRKIMRPVYNFSAASSFSSCSAKLSRRFLSVSESFLYISSTRFAPPAAFFFFAPYAFFSLSEPFSRSLPLKR